MLIGRCLAGLAFLAGVWGCTTIVGVNHDYHLECDASGPDATDAAPTCSGDTGQIVVTVQVVSGGPDRGALVAVKDGLPDTSIAGNATLWPVEKAKTWITIAASVPFLTGQATYAASVPPGDYALQLWDRFGGGGAADNGIPPNNHYPWQIGNASRTVHVATGGVVQVTATNTQVNVPAGAAFYGSWTLWDYGPCAGAAACPSGTTCAQGTCVDLSYDIRNCGTAGTACQAQDCCGGSCISPLTDGANCGSCGIACQAPATCQSGACK